MDSPEEETAQGPVEDPVGDVPPMTDPPKRGPGRPRKSDGASSGSTAPTAAAADRAPKRQRASDTAKRAAGTMYALVGTGAQLGGFHGAGIVMQAQSPNAGRVIAQHAMLNWPRFYSMLERTGKSSEILPLFLVPLAAEMFVRSDNEAAVTLAYGLLNQLGGDLVATVPNESGQLEDMRVVDVLAQLRMSQVNDAAGEAETPAEAAQNGDQRVAADVDIL